MKKKTAILALALLLVAVIATGITLASFTASVRTTNVVTTGNVNIDLMEEGRGPSVHLPTETVPRPVWVRNTGRNSAFIRVELTPVWQGGAAGFTPAPDAIEYLLADSGDWLRGEDGYWYYQKILEPGQDTSRLLEGYRIAPLAVDNAYSGLSVEVEVTAHAIQTAHLEQLLAGGRITGWEQDGGDAYQLS